MSDDIETWLRAQVDDDETLAESDYDIMISARKVRDVVAEITRFRAERDALQARVATVEDALADALISLHSAKLFILKKYGSINSAREASLECGLMVLSESANKEIAQAANEALVNRAALEGKKE